MQNIILNLRNKNFQKAALLCREALKHSNHPQLSLFLAIALGELGKIKESSLIFNKLSKSFPHNSDIFYNHALVLEKNQKFNLALNSYNSCLRLNPTHMGCLTNLANLNLKLKKINRAIRLFDKIQKLSSGKIANLRLSNCYILLNDIDTSLSYFKNAIRNNTHSLDVILNFLFDLSQNTNPIHTISFCKVALSQYNNNLNINSLIGECYLKIQEAKNAIPFLKKACKSKPKQTDLYYNLISAYSMLGKPKKIKKYSKILIKTKSLNSFVFVATIYEKLFKLKKSSSFVQNGLKLFPESDQLLYLQAKILKHKKQYNQAFHCINKAIDNQSQMDISQLLFEKSHIHDKLKQYNKAWSVALNANQTRLANWQKIHQSPNQYLYTCQQICTSFKANNTITVSKLAPAKKEHQNKIIFILGFMRSGTTLLDSILSSYDNSIILEELPIISDLFNSLKLKSPNKFCEQILNLSQSEIQKLRRDYFNAINKYMTLKKNTVIVDKSPINTSLVAFIYTLFPESKIIFSQRHPLDVCTSCFFQDFKFNSFMTNMVDIVSIAKTYDAMLSVWKKSITFFNIEFKYQSYESLVSSFEQQSKELFAYLELPWKKNVLHFQKSLKKRGAISTPSYNQVNQPIYQTAKNRYKNYLPYLGEAIEILQPWIDYFDYDV